MYRQVLVVDDEQDFLSSIRRSLVTAGLNDLATESDPRKAAGFFRSGGDADVVLIDVCMPGMNGTDLLKLIKDMRPETECIMLTAVDDAQTAIQCMKLGAYDYLIKPVSRDNLILSIQRALERKRLLAVAELGKEPSKTPLKHPEAFQSIDTCSTLVMRVLREAELHAASTVPVLITGETGTGKELLARAIHKASLRADRVFTPVNMAALTPSLFDAEFFGHTRGAFTGAERERAGYLEHTSGGTLFLDEIGTLNNELQGKLLRVLQEKEYYKIGSSTPRTADIRCIAATNADLKHLMQQGSFRKDLYYRLRGAWLHLPPLRERREDIEPLLRAFLDGLPSGAGTTDIRANALEALKAYDFPGNIRELRQIIESAVNLAHGRSITINALPEHIRTPRKASSRQTQSRGVPAVPLAEVERTHILSVYEECDGNKTAAAELLGIGLNTLRRKLKSYGRE